MRIEQIKLTVSAGSPDALPAVHIGIEPHDAVTNLVHVHSFGLTDQEEVVRFLRAVVDTIDPSDAEYVELRGDDDQVIRRHPRFDDGFQPGKRVPFNPQRREDRRG